MKTIAYYISDYGFGHASRSIAIIRTLFNRSNHELKIIICHSFALSFLKESLRGLNVEFRNVATDVGYVLKPRSMDVDKELLTRKYLEFTNEWNSKTKEEKIFLQKKNIDFVISDISPLPFMPAKELGIPSAGVSNFTWHSAYKGLIEEEHLDEFDNAYRSMDSFYALASSKEVHWSSEIRDYGFIAREVNREETFSIRQKLNPNKDKLVIYLGLGMKVDTKLEDLKLWNSPNCIFIVSNNIEVNVPNVYKIPANSTESQNYIAAADIVITKAGWGTVSEAVLNNKPLLILDRRNMNEDRNTIDYLNAINKVTLFSWNEFSNLTINKELLEKLKKQNDAKTPNDIGRLVTDLLKYLS